MELSKKFVCDDVALYPFEIAGEKFVYSDCEVLGERDSNALPTYDVVLKNKLGYFAEITIRSQESKAGKESIRSGEYGGRLISAKEAEDLGEILNIFPNSPSFT